MCTDESSTIKQRTFSKVKVSIIIHLLLNRDCYAKALKRPPKTPALQNVLVITLGDPNVLLQTKLSFNVTLFQSH